MSLNKVPSFKPNGEDQTNIDELWGKWMRKFENYLIAADVTEDERKKALLLNFAGDEVFDIFEALPNTGSSYQDAVNSLQNYFVAQKMNAAKFPPHNVKLGKPSETNIVKIPKPKSETTIAKTPKPKSETNTAKNPKPKSAHQPAEVNSAKQPAKAKGTNQKPNDPKSDAINQFFKDLRSSEANFNNGLDQIPKELNNKLLQHCNNLDSQDDLKSPKKINLPSQIASGKSENITASKKNKPKPSNNEAQAAPGKTKTNSQPPVGTDPCNTSGENTKAGKSSKSKKSKGADKQDSQSNQSKETNMQAQSSTVEKGVKDLIISKAPKEQKKINLCRLCGEKWPHGPENPCPAIGKVCFSCGQSNHLANVCNQKAVKAKLLVAG